MHRTVLDRDDLRELLENRDFPKITITMPLHGIGPEAQQDPIRLRNLLGRAGDGLEALGVRAPEELLAPLQALLADKEFWNSQDKGLAAFLSENLFLALRLPMEFAETVEVGDRFLVRHLLPYFETEGFFFLLAVSRNGVRLFRCTRDGSEEVAVANLPAGLAYVLRYDVYEKNLVAKTAGGLGSKRRFYHGVGGGEENTDDEMLRFLRAVDKAVAEHLRGRTAPLVLAGVEEILPVYKRVNTYPHLLDAIVPGSPDRADGEELRTRAWPLLLPSFETARNLALERLERLTGSSRASTALRELIPAAFHGRVETLFLSRGAQAWGVFDPRGENLSIHTEHQPADQDLLDVLAAYTLLKGGTVYVLPQVPGGMMAAGIYRY